LFFLLVISLFGEKNNLIRYYMARSFEIKGSSTSGYYRFILPFKIGFNNMFGYGVGNDDIALKMYNASEFGITNGFGKIMVELGWIGLFLIIVFFMSIKPNKKIM
jgi:hypothetical protein